MRRVAAEHAWNGDRAPSLQQLIRIDVDGGEDVFGQRKFVERFADETAQAHDRFAAHQNVETKLALQFFQRRGRGRAKNEFGGQRLFQSARECLGGKLRARFVRGADGDQDRVFEWRKIAALPEFQFLLEVAGEIMMPRELNRRD